MHTILVASLTDHTHDGRIARQISTLSTQYRVLSAGTSPPLGQDVEYLHLPSPTYFAKPLGHRVLSGLRLLARRYESYYWSRPWVMACEDKLREARFDLALVNDLPLLPLVIRLAGSRPVIFDAHEYYPRQHENEWFFRCMLRPYLTHLCQRYIPAAAATMTVSPGLVSEYAREFGVSTLLVRNTPRREKLLAAPVTAGRIRLVHHGIAKRDRQIELLLAAVERLDSRFELHLFLKGDDVYVEELKRRSVLDPRVHFHAAIPNSEVCTTIQQFDLGLIVYQPLTLNLKFCLPNKFFEYVQARLGVVVGPSPDMARLVHDGGFGVVASGFTPQALAATLNRLTASDIERMKRQADAAAEELCWENEGTILGGLVGEVLSCSHSLILETRRHLPSCPTEAAR